MSGAAFWTRETCIDALQTWAAEHGKTPSDNTDWCRGGYGHPSGKTVARIFGSWNAGIVAAGLTPHGPGRVGYWTRELVAAAMLDWMLEHGRWPEMNDWKYADPNRSRPTTGHVRLLFGGSWTKAKRAAGWAAECRQCGGDLGERARASQLWCSRICRHRHDAGHPPVWAVEALCVECGRLADEEDYTTGCLACSHRKHNRLVRARRAVENGTHVSVVESLPTSDSDASQPGRAMAPVRPVDFQPEKAAA